MENDPAHVPFVHRETRFFTDIPYVSAIEMDYGSRETVTFENREGYVHRIMPNGRSFVTPVQDVPGGWTENLIFQVPVDDESHLGFGIQLHHIPAEAADTVRKQFGFFPGGQGRNPQADIAASVLRGEMTLDDVEDRQFIVNLQDLVSQWGQGTIRDHTQDRLGRSDAGVTMLRRLWERELRNLSEGKALKGWTIPERIELTADYHG
jgi:5,5'-dehydrodivanillate O-demethylase